MRLAIVVWSALVGPMLVHSNETRAGVIINGGNSFLRIDLPLAPAITVIQPDQSTVPLLFPSTTYTSPDGGVGTISASITTFNSGSAAGLSPMVTETLTGPPPGSADGVGVGGQGILDLWVPIGNVVATISGEIKGTLGDGARLVFDLNNSNSTVPNSAIMDFHRVIDQPGDFDITFLLQSLPFSNSGFPLGLTQSPDGKSVLMEIQMHPSIGITGGTGTVSLDPGVGITIPGADDQVIPEPASVLTWSLLGCFIGLGTLHKHRALLIAPSGA